MQNCLIELPLNDQKKIIIWIFYMLNQKTILKQDTWLNDFVEIKAEY